MDLIHLLVIVGLICFAFFANNKWVEAPGVRLTVNVVLIIVVVVIVLAVSGVLGPLRSIKV